MGAGSLDIVIVGAGAHGAAAAYHLARRGVGVTVVDRLGVAEGPTGRSSAVCRAFYTNPFLAEVARDALAMFGDFDSIAPGADPGFERTGALYLHAPEHVHDLERTVADLRSIGTEVDLLEPEQIAQRHPSFALDGVGAGAWEPGGGYADPVGTTTGLMQAARERGASLLAGREVVGIDPGGDRVRVRLDDGATMDADRVLVAAGPWTRRLAGTVGVDLPLVVERHYVGSFAWGEVDPVPFVIADLPAGYYAKPERGGQFFVGALHPEPQVDPDDFDERIREDEQVTLLRAAMQRNPALAEAGIRGGWASLYDVSPDWQPVVGEIAPGVFVDAGTSGHGFKLAPAWGRHVADLLTDDGPDPRLAQFHPDRFGRGEDVAAGFGEARIIG